VETVNFARSRYYCTKWLLKYSPLSAHLQCDESRPMCKRCTAYGTFCNYDPRHSDLQPLAHGKSDVQTLQTPLCSENQAALGIINGTTSLQPTGSTHPSHGGFHFSVQDLELLHKFHTRTILTLGTPKSRHIYQNAYAKLAYSVCHLYSVFLFGV
jgi:hypothetical protein